MRFVMRRPGLRIPAEDELFTPTSEAGLVGSWMVWVKMAGSDQGPPMRVNVLEVGKRARISPDRGALARLSNLQAWT